MAIIPAAAHFFRQAVVRLEICLASGCQPDYSYAPPSLLQLLPCPAPAVVPLGA